MPVAFPFTVDGRHRRPYGDLLGAVRETPDIVALASIRSYRASFITPARRFDFFRDWATINVLRPRCFIPASVPTNARRKAAAASCRRRRAAAFGGPRPWEHGGAAKRRRLRCAAGRARARSIRRRTTTSAALSAAAPCRSRPRRSIPKSGTMELFDFTGEDNTRGADERQR